MPTTINDLANLPHHEGQRVLMAEREDLDVQIIRWGNGYVVHAAVKQPGGGAFTILSAERKGVDAARELARDVWAKGRDFNVVIGSQPKEKP
jgi:hypothetical protein